MEPHMEAPETLTKADLSRHLIERLECGKADADLLVVTFLESIVTSLRAGEGAELRGFGSFRLPFTRIDVFAPNGLLLQKHAQGE
jgi:hypothetical protein